MPKKVSTEISIQIGQRIHKVRKQAKMTQLELALKMGLSMQQIQKYESGSTTMSIERLFEMANVLNVPIEYFLTNDEKNSARIDNLLTAVIELINVCSKDSSTEEEKTVALQRGTLAIYDEKKARNDNQ